MVNLKKMRLEDGKQKGIKMILEEHIITFGQLTSLFAYVKIVKKTFFIKKRLLCCSDSFFTA